jgi:aspartate/methionine/tyrosine aminotransferase
MVPRLVVEDGKLRAINSIGADIPQNQMFDLRAVLREFSKDNPTDKIYDASQGDGGASLPGIPKYILEDAHSMISTKGTGYGPPHGSEEFRSSVIEDYWKLDPYLKMGPKNVAATCGGRDALLKAYTAAQELGCGRRGDFIVTTSVPWISYNWGPYSVGANVIQAGGSPERGWALQESEISKAIEYAKSLERNVACLIITSPDNPTGRYTDLDRQLDLIRYALERGVKYVLLDWMYHWVSDLPPYSLNYLLISLDPEERKRVIVLDGITKSLGGSNIRNAHLVADEAVIDHIRYRASHGIIPGYFGQAVSMVAYKAGFEFASKVISEPTSESRSYMQSYLDQWNVDHIIGQGYYAFINVEQYIKAKGMKDSAELGIWLARNHGLAIVPGIYFSEAAADWVRFSYATKPADARANIEKLHTLLVG